MCSDPALFVSKCLLLTSLMIRFRRVCLYRYGVVYVNFSLFENYCYLGT